MNAKAAMFSFSLFLVIFLLVAETTLAKPKAFQVEHYARKRMFLADHENPEATREIVERNIPATPIDDNVCFGSKGKGFFIIKEKGELVILRVDYKPSLPAGKTKDLKLVNKKGEVNPDYTTSDNIHFDFRFDSKPYPVSPGQKFGITEKSGSGEETCVSVYGYFSE